MDSDCQNVRKYKEFERSAQSEWVDLGIDLHAFIAGQPTGEPTFQAPESFENPQTGTVSRGCRA
jgi:hypothetical protein